ncbi:MAG: sugar transferase, partial [Planctomycetaceae bacterium]
MIVPRNPRWLWLKTTVEIVLAFLLLVLSLPVIFLAGLIVKLTSPGSALYWQTRVGLRGREFRLCKIRTM